MSVDAIVWPGPSAFVPYNVLMRNLLLVLQLVTWLVAGPSHAVESVGDSNGLSAAIAIGPKLLVPHGELAIPLPMLHSQFASTTKLGEGVDVGVRLGADVIAYESGDLRGGVDFFWFGYAAAQLGVRSPVDGLFFRWYGGVLAGAAVFDSTDEGSQLVPGYMAGFSYPLGTLGERWSMHLAFESYLYTQHGTNGVDVQEYESWERDVVLHGVALLFEFG